MKHAREADAGAAAKRSKGQVARVGEIGFAKVVPGGRGAGPAACGGAGEAPRA
jgi:hypothetical protein